MRLHVAEAVRAAVFLWLGYTAVMQRPWRFAELPDVLRFPLRVFPVPDLAPWVVGAGAAVLLVVSVVAAVGVRWAMLASVTLGWWVLGVPQMYGKVNHYHHLLWLGLLFAVLPLASALRWTWPGVGLLYLFPGLAKLGNADDLVFGDEMLRIITRQQQSQSWDPPFHFGVGVGQAMAVGTIVLEVGFVVLAFTRWRRWGALAAAGFHVSVYALTGIQFWSLLMVVLLLALDRDRGRLDWQPVAVGLLALVALMGVSGRQGWPFAPYPHFAESSDDSLRLEVYDGGRVVDWLPHLSSARRGGMARNVIRGDPSLWGERCAALGGTECWAVTITPEGEDRQLLTRS